MEQFFQNKKNLIIALIVLSVLILGFVFIKSRSANNQRGKDLTSEEEILPESELIPTVDASVSVSLAAQNKKREVVLKIEGIPNGTQQVEYELSYQTTNDIPKGVIGTIDIENEKEIERKITLGTCSAGKCVYDEGVERIKVYLKFSGDYGSQLFDKEFTI